jgi:hypothetical protein
VRGGLLGSPAQRAKRAKRAKRNNSGTINVQAGAWAVVGRQRAQSSTRHVMEDYEALHSLLHYF